MKVKVALKSKTEINFPDLTQGNIYRVIGIENDQYRILSDEGKPCLFPPDIFEVNNRGGEDWITENIEGKEYSYPAELNSPGFFENYFDREETAMLIFEQYMAKLCGKSIKSINIQKYH